MRGDEPQFMLALQPPPSPPRDGDRSCRQRRPLQLFSQRTTLHDPANPCPPPNPRPPKPLANLSPCHPKSLGTQNPWATGAPTSPTVWIPQIPRQLDPCHSKALGIPNPAQRGHPAPATGQGDAPAAPARRWAVLGQHHEDHGRPLGLTRSCPLPRAQLREQSSPGAAENSSGFQCQLQTSLAAWGKPQLLCQPRASCSGPSPRRQPGELPRP